MSDIISLFSELIEADIKLSLEGENLKVNAPAGALTDEIRQKIVSRKPEVIAFLKQNQATKENSEGNAKSSIPIIDRDTQIPVTYAQQRLWVLNKLQPGMATYNIPMAVRISGPLNTDAMKKTLASILERHETLRTRLIESPNDNTNTAEIYQKITPYHPALIDDYWHYDYTSYTKTNSNHIDKTIENITAKEAAYAFDIEQGPLLRFSLIAFSKDDHLLIANMHHAISDGWSVNVLINDIGQYYQAITNKITPQVQPLDVQYADFAAWRHHWIASGEHQIQLDYWVQQLADAPTLLTLPTDRPRPEQQSFAGAEYTFSFSNELSQTLKKLCQQNNITSFMLLLSAYQLVLSRYSGQDKVNIGIPSAGRNRKELEPLIGFFVNILVMKGDFSRNITVNELLQQTKRTTLDAFANEDLPMELIIEALGIEWNPAYPTLAQVGFALQSSTELTRGDSMQMGELSLSGVSPTTTSSKYDFILFASEDPEQFNFTIEYNTDLFDLDTIEQLCSHFKYALEQFTDHIDQPIHTLELVSHEELTQLFVNEQDIPQYHISSILPLSATQTDLFLAHLVNPDTLDNSLGQYVELYHEIDITLWKQALQTLVNQYSMLRARLVCPNKPYAEIAYFAIKSHTEVPFEFIDVSDQKLDNKAFYLRLKQRIYQPYDLHTDSLYQFELIKRAENSYVFVLACNHIAFDGTAMSFTLKQAVASYEALLKKSTPSLPNDSLYSFIKEARSRFDGSVNQLFWEKQLSNTGPLNFGRGSTVKRHVTNAESNGKLTSRSDAMSEKQWAAFQQHCATRSLSASAVLKNLYAILIHYYCKPESDFIIRETISGRSETYRQTLATCHQTAPYIVSAATLSDKNASVSSLLESGRKFNRKSKAYQAISLFQQNRLTPYDSIGFMFNLYNFDHELTLHGKPFEIKTLAPLDLNGQIQLIALVKNDRLELQLHYQKGIFQDHRFIERLIHLAEQLISGVDRINQLDFLLPDEPNALLQRNPLLKESNLNKVSSNESPQDKSQSLIQRFECIVKKHPDRIAVDSEDSTLNYTELNQQANYLAHYLIEKGIKPGDKIGICLSRSTHLLVSIVGVLKAGAAYVPLDPHFPADRLSFILQDANATALITEQSSSSLINGFVGLRIIVDADDNANFIAKNPHWGSNPAKLAHPQHIAYVLYTSGTTGTPKGCLVQHRNVTRLFDTTQDQFSFDENDVWTLFHSYAFDFTVWEMWGALLYGGKLIVVPYLTARTPDTFYQLLVDKKVTVLNQTPSAFSQLNHQVQKNESAELSLRYIIFGGEPIDIGAIQKWVDQKGWSSAKLVNMYGITETTVHASYRLINEASLGDKNTLNSIGRPLDDLCFYLLDEHSRLTPPGLSGQIAISGPGVSLGYHNRVSLTQERFIANPFIEQLSQTLPNDVLAHHHRLYLSGDLARYLDNGELEYLGRIDDQINIRGHRVELGEIENNLQKLSYIREAIVTVKEVDTENQQLIAYLLVSEDIPQDQNSNNLDTTKIKQYLGTQLPDYMVPASFYALDEWPLTPTGKVDKNALDQISYHQNLPANSNYIEPNNEIEQAIVETWQELLNVEKIGSQDNFFELGGHSLLVTRSATRLQEKLNTPLTLRELFEHPTAQTLAVVVQQKHNIYTQKFDNKTGVALVRLSDEERQKPQPLSWAQQRLWLLQQFDTQSSAYHIPYAIGIKGKLNTNALNQALCALVERHEILRTQFLCHEDSPVQQVQSGEDWSLQHTLVTPKDLLDKSLSHRLNEFIYTPFDLHHDALFRAELIEVSQSDNTRFSESANQQYMLMLNLHHIIADGWSIDILMHDARQLYTHFDQFTGTTSNPVLSPLPIQYLDYAVWQRQWLSGDRLEKQLNYWQQTLSDSPTLNLPTDFYRSVPIDANGAVISTKFSSKLHQQLKSFSQNQGSTLFMTMLGAFQVLLSQYCGQEDICIGTPIANRQHSKLESLVGFFVNTLVIRNQVNQASSFTEHLQLVKNTALNAFENQDTPFEMLVEQLNISRNITHNPLFQVMFSLQSNEQVQYDKLGYLGEAQLHDVGELLDGSISTMPAKFDLTLNIESNAQELIAHFEYRTALFKPETIHRLAKLYEHIIISLIENPTLALCEATTEQYRKSKQITPIFSSAKRSKAPKTGNIVIYDANSISDLFERQVQKTPNTTAITHAKQQITYAELNSRSNQFAHYLIQGYQAEPGKCISICLPHSIDLMIAILGVIKTGATYIPIDPNYPSERVCHILQDSKVQVLVTEPAFTNIDNNSTVQICHFSHITKELEKQNVTTPNVNHHIDNVLYIIYTSGSTGKPKGAMIKHRGALNLLTWYKETFDFSSTDNTLVISAIGFDLTQKNLFTPLISGGKLVFCEGEKHSGGVVNQTYDDRAIVNAIDEHQITHINCAPSAFYPLVHKHNLQKINPLASLRYVLLGGESIQIESILPWLQHPDTRAQLVNMYGPTECTDIASFYPIEHPDQFTNQAIPIGKASKNVQLYVMDTQGHILPPGMQGELVIGGEGVGTGYINQPELTEKTFFTNEQGEALYRTGDLVREQADGNLVFIGRIDQQVKIRGLRIEPAEIEYALKQIDGVKDALVMVKNDQLIGYVTTQKRELEQWRNALANYLPSYMLPQQLILLDAWPLTPNGKIDRKALPAATCHKQQDKQDAVTDTEKALAAIWQHLLSTGFPPCIDQNFFELGGHSLLAVQVFSRIREQFDLDLELRELFEHPTIRLLAKRIDNVIANELQSSRPTLKAYTETQRPKLIPLSYNQSRLWLVYQMNPKSPAYNMPMAVRIRGELDIEALNQAFKALIKQQESLRTSMHLAPEDSGIDAYQTIHSMDEEAIANWQLSHVGLANETNPLELARTKATEHAIKPFDITQAPLLTAELLSLDTANSDHVILINMHHIISDGWSTKLFIESLSQAYLQARSGNTASLPELDVQYADFAIWQHEWLQGDVLQKQLNYWQDYLAGSPPLLTLPTDRPRPAIQSDNGAGLDFDLPGELVKRVHQIANDQSITPFMILLSAYSVLLSRYSGQKDLCIGIPIAGRHIGAIEPLIGFFVNALIIRSKLDDNPSVHTLVEQVKNNVLNAFAHQDVPTELVIKALNIEHSSSYNPIAQVGFNHLPASVETDQLEVEGLSFETLEAERISAKYDMIWAFKEHHSDGQDGIHGIIEYNRDLFNATTLETMVPQYIHIVESIVDALSNYQQDGQQKHVDKISLLPNRQLYSELNISPDEFEDIRPLTAIQSAMVLDAQLNPNNRRESLGYIHHVDQNVDIETWQKSVDIVCNHFSTLRTRVISADKPYLDHSYAAIARPVSIDSLINNQTNNSINHGRKNRISPRVEIIDFSDTKFEDLDQDAFYQSLSEVVFAPYQLDSQPLFRSRIYRFANGVDKIFGCAHHIVLDGIGMQMYTAHTVDVYARLKAGETVEAILEALPADNVAKYQHDLGQKHDEQNVHHYWQEQVKTHKLEALSFTPKSTYLDSNTENKPQLHSTTTIVDQVLWEEVQTWCRKTRTTPAQFFKALYCILLKAYSTANSDVITEDYSGSFYINEVLTGRPKGHLQSLGCYFEQSPFVVPGDLLKGNGSFKDLLKYGQKYRKQVKQGQPLSLQLAQVLLPQSGTQCLYNFYPMPKTQTFMGGEYLSEQFSPEMSDSIALIARVVADTTTDTDKHKTQDSTAQRLHLIFSYTDNIFDDTGNSSIAAPSESPFISKLLSLAKQVVDGAQTLGELSFSDASHTVTHHKAPNYSVNNVAELVHQQAIKTPNNTALICGNKALTYSELHTKANKLANYLLDSAVEKSSDEQARIAILLPPTQSYIIALLASIKSGATYIPIDVNYPSERIRYICEDSQADVVITTSDIATSLPQDINTCCIDAIESELSNKKGSEPTINTSLEDLLYIIYTSGSTGQPKGAAVKHRGEINLLSWYQKECEFTESSHTLVFSALGFDLTQKNIFASLNSGGTLVLSESLQHGYDDQIIRNEIAQHNIQHINCAPSAFYQIVENTQDYPSLNSLKQICFGGEAINLTPLMPWLASDACNASVMNMYGPTECTDIAAYYRINEPSSFIDQVIPIGSANDHVQLYVMDSEQRLLPQGIAGELVIGGEGVGAGYIGKDKDRQAILNQERFIEKDGQRLYRTGDLVKQNPDGLFEFIRRIDHQVKIRGLRVELGEIEYALRHINGVKDSLAVVQNDTLSAYAVIEKGIAVDNWRETLATFLPSHMIPASLTELAQWPLTPNGKIDRKALPSPLDKNKRPYVAPQNELQAQLATLWQQVLGLDAITQPISIHDNFFELGGHSLLATRAVARIREQFSVELPLRDVFTQPTIAGISALILQQQAKSANELSLKDTQIEVIDRSQPLPLSYAQQRLWFLAQLDANSAAYNMPAVLKVSGNLDLTILERAFNAIIERHETLRTRIDTVQGEAQVIIENEHNWSLDIINLKNVADDEQSDKIRTAIKANTTAPFNLAQGPLFRANVIQTKQDEFILLFTLHHIISDGWSNMVLIRELGQLYHAYSNGQGSPLTPLPIQYVDYANWQRHWLQGELLESQLDFWRKTLKGAPDLLRMPTDRPRPAIQTYNGAIYSFTIDSQLSGQVKQLSYSQNSTLFMTLLSAYQIMLSRYSGMTDICVGIPSAGRVLPQLDELIGFFVNALVIRGDLSNNPSLQQVLEQVKTTSSDAFAHELVPAEMVLNELGIERDLSYTPLAQHAFTLTNANEVNTLSGNSAQSLDLPGGIKIEEFSEQEDGIVAKFDIMLSLIDLGEASESGLQASVEYNTDLYNESTIAEFIHSYQLILQAMVNNLDQPVTAIELQQPQSLLQKPEPLLQGYTDKQDDTLLPLTSMQRDLYLASINNEETKQNSLGYAVKLPFVVDVDLWKQSIELLTARFSMLRMNLVSGKQLHADNQSLTKAQQALTELAYQIISQPDLNDSNYIDFTYLDWSNRSYSESELQTHIDQTIHHSYQVESDEALVKHQLIKLNHSEFLTIKACHHTTLDGFGSALFAQHLLDTYTRLEDGLTPNQALEKLPQDVFPEFITQERHSFDRRETITYWKNALQNTAALHPVNTISNAQPVSTKTPQVILRHPIDSDHFDAIKQYCRQYRITPAIYFKSLMGLMVQYYCASEQDIAITEFGAGRPKGHSDSLGCYYTSQLWVFDSNSMTGSNTIKDVFDRAKAFQKTSRDKHSLSILKQRQLCPEGGLSFSFNFLAFEQTGRYRDIVVDSQRFTPNSDGVISFQVQTTNDQLLLGLDYPKSQFNEQNFLARIHHISKQLIHGVENLNELNFLLDEEVQTLKAVNQAAVAPLSSHIQKLRIHQYIEQRAQRSSNKVAVVCGEQTLTYQQLNEQANQLAHHLTKEGLQAQQRVVLYFEQRHHYLIGILAVLKAHGIYVPIEAQDTGSENRLKQILEDSLAPFVLTDTDINVQSKLVDINSVIENADNAHLNNLDLPVSQDDGFYTLYTSGSTGKPKGVTVTHANVDNLVHWYRSEFEFNANDTSFIMSSVGFDLTQKNLLTPLLCGGKIILAESRVYDVNQYLTQINQNQVTHINCAPSAFYPLVNDSRNHSKAIDTLNHLSLLQFGGERIELSQIADWLESEAFNTKIVNMYGPTECTDIASFEYLDLNTSDNEPALGLPNHNVQLQLLNPHGQLVPPNFKGELVIRGLGVSQGYIQTELNEAVFYRTNKAQSQTLVIDEDSGLSEFSYRTGDIARFDSIKQRFFYHGRNDFQLKINGQRVEAGEIEHHIRSLNPITDALIMPGANHQTLVGFVITEQSQPIPDNWRELLSNKLPSAWLPRQLIRVDQWPLTANGKIDRKKLALLETTSLESTSQIKVARNDIEAKLCTIWQGVLNQNTIGVSDNFFELGGDSISAVKLVAEMEQTFDVQLPISALFHAQTIETVARVITQKKTQWSPIVPLNDAALAVNALNENQNTDSEGTSEYKKPLFIVHAIGGMLYGFEKLTFSMPENQPVYGIQAYGFEENQAAFTDIKAMANYYVQSLKQYQEKGPYQIAGFSFGGLVAFEMARILKAQDEDISFLCLMDTYMPNKYLVRETNDAEVLHNFVEKNFGKLPRGFIRKFKGLDRETLVDAVEEELKGTIKRSLLYSVLDTSVGFNKMLVNYQPEPLDVDAFLIRPTDTTTGAKGLISKMVFRDNAMTLGWDKITNDNLEVVVVEGNHLDILEGDDVSEVVAAMSARLES